MDAPPRGLPGHGFDVDEAHAWLAHQYAAGTRPLPAFPSKVLIGQLGRFSEARVLGPEPQEVIRR